MKKFKFSKAYIWVFLYRFAFLLFVPFFQLLLFGDVGADILFTLYSADLLLGGVIIVVAVLRCSKAGLEISDRKLVLRQGIILKTCDIYLKSSKKNRTLTRPLALRFLRAGALRFSSALPSACGYLKKQDAYYFFEKSPDKSNTVSYKSGIFKNLLMSAVFSNVLTGLLAASPVIRRAAAVMGARQSALILSGANPEYLPFIRDLPPVLSKISSVLFLCWVIGFFTEFFREYQLKLTVSDHKIRVSKGLVTKYVAEFDKSQIKTFECRQSLMLFLLGLQSARIAVNLKPSSKIHILSAVKSTKADEVRSLFFATSKSSQSVLYPKRTAIGSYVLLPFVFICGVTLSSLFIQNPIVIILLYVVILISVIWYFFRIFAFLRSFLCVRGNLWEISYLSRLNFVRTTFFAESITQITLTQNVISRMDGRCNLTIYLSHNKKLKAKIKHLNFREVQNLLSNLP